ncbi:hypothetical protein BH10CYA1_BH10CYA1_29240 [soil metagenome]
MTEHEFHHISKSDLSPELTSLGSEHNRDEILGGRYRVISLLGRGGMGVVYKVEQIFLGKELALKTIDQASQSEAAIQRFQAEARAVFAVNHPNIVSVHDFGLLEDQTPFLAMEYIQGSTIGELIQARTLRSEDALPIFIQVCLGLAHAHKRGVVHRDIKPNNIMVLDGLQLGTEGSVKILDFGIAKLTQHDGGEIQALTRTGEIFGSPIYMSPEQCIGARIDHRSDIYSLGCVIFEVLTGTPPFVGDSALSTMMMHQTGAIPTLKEASLGADFSSELEHLVCTMLAKNPDDRYQDLGLAAQDLSAIRSGQTANLSITARSAPKVTVRTAQTISLRRTDFVLSIVAVALVSIVGTFLIMQMWFLSQQRTEIKTTVDTKSSSTERPQITQALPPEPVHRFAAAVSRKEVAFKAGYVTDADMRDFRGYDGAQSVEINRSDVGALTNKGLSYLSSSKLLNLTLRSCPIENIDSITQLPYLTHLNLEKSWITDSAMSKVAELKMLEDLNLSGCKNLSEDGIRRLIQSSSLRSIRLPKTFSTSFIEEIKQKMPQCKLLLYEIGPPLMNQE